MSFNSLLPKVMHKPLCMLSLLTLSIVMPLQAHALDTAGRVKTLSAPALISNNGITRTLQIGDEIYVGDEIRTRSKGALGIVFKDGAVMSIGPNSRILIDTFLFKPETKEVGFGSQIFKGTMSFISGAIGRIAPEKVKFRTPTATLGLRGTKILVEVKSPLGL